MTEEEQTLLMIQGAIANLSVEDSIKVREITEKLEQYLKESPANARFAIALCGAKLAMES